MRLGSLQASFWRARGSNLEASRLDFEASGLDFGMLGKATGPSLINRKTPLAEISFTQPRMHGNPPTFLLPEGEAAVVPLEGFNGIGAEKASNSKIHNPEAPLFPRPGAARCRRQLKIINIAFWLFPPYPPGRQLRRKSSLPGRGPTPSKPLGTTFFQFWMLSGAF